MRVGGGGGYHTGGGEHVKFYPYKNGVHTKFWGSFCMVA